MKNCLKVTESATLYVCTQYWYGPLWDLLRKEGDEELADQALKIEEEIQKAKEEHSLNQLEMEKKIRSSLLADLFKICDKKMDLAKNILNNLVEMVRNQSEAKVSS